MPLAGAALTVFLISLVGLPPTAGFIGKLMIFAAMLNKGDLYIVLALIGILTSVISLYYYMLIPLNMFLREAPQSETKSMDLSMPTRLIMIALMVLTIYFGLYFAPLSDFAKYSSALYGMSIH